MTKPVVLHAFPLPHRARAPLAERYDLHGPLDTSAAEAVPEAARGARVLVTLGGLRTGAALMAALPDLGLIACYGTGYEGVDRAAAAARGILVTHGGDANATSVAEFAMGLVLAAARLVLRGDGLVRAGRWREGLPLVPGLAGRRIGVYGLGSIGLRIARRAEAFEMEVGYHNRSPRGDVPYAWHGSLAGLAAWADVLVVAVRAGAENRHSVGREVLDALGREGVLVNVARGLVVDHDALCEALEGGRIAGAGLDVHEAEPHVPERLRALGNAVLTPHMAAMTTGAQAAQVRVLLDNLDAFFAGRPLRWLAPAVQGRADRDGDARPR